MSRAKALIRLMEEGMTNEAEVNDSPDHRALRGELVSLNQQWTEVHNEKKTLTAKLDKKLEKIEKREAELKEQRKVMREAAAKKKLEDDAAAKAGDAQLPADKEGKTQLKVKMDDKDGKK